MNARMWRQWAGVALTAGVVVLTGCKNKEGAKGGAIDTSWYEGTDSYLARRRAEQYAVRQQPQPMATPKEAAPEVRVEQRKSSYRPNAGANMNVASLAIPTGEESTSALLIHEVIPREVRSNTPFDYEIHVTNLTGNALNNVQVETENTQNFAILSSTPQGQPGGGGGMRWTIGELGPHETEIIKVQARAEKVGAATNCIDASYASALCAGTNVIQPAIALTKTVPAEVLGCDVIAIKYEVKNTGSGSADGIKVRDTLPAGLTTADGKNTVEFDAGTLGAGQSKVFTVNAKAAKPGRYEGGATASGNHGLSAQASPVATTVRQPVLSIEADCGADSIMIGRNAAFKFTVKNTGDAPANNTVITASLPQGSQFASADSGGAASAGGVSWNLGALAPGASKTVSYQARSMTSGTLQSTAKASAQCAADVSDNCQTQVQGVPDIGSMLTDAEGVVLVGDNHVYELDVANQGQVDLTNVKLVFTIPDGISFVSVQGVAPPAASGNALTFNLGTLKAKEKKPFKITVKSARAGEFKVSTDVTADQIKQPMHRDEITVFVDR